MNRYLVESTHAPEDCAKAAEQVLASGYITHFDWGCKAGVHTAWALIEAESEAEARMTVPTFLRPKARVVQVLRYSPEDFK